MLQGIPRKMVDLVTYASDLNFVGVEVASHTVPQSPYFGLRDLKPSSGPMREGRQPPLLTILSQRPILGIQGQVSTSISPFLSLSGMESNLQTSCLTKQAQQIDRPWYQAVPAIPSAGLSSLSAFQFDYLISGLQPICSHHISGLPTLLILHQIPNHLNAIEKGRCITCNPIQVRRRSRIAAFDVANANFVRIELVNPTPIPFSTYGRSKF
ncbi:hypothetical protein EVAR_100967_1 [Eumeta japonica]|uniref:Uncharacterized protein n=1 Tax=Eumeta variegata TaxID=151549 RepID=A0A4C2A8X4_EUMVA|nr:hypothetical protein EVAR_100967_1 [Eumeta japonica]